MTAIKICGITRMEEIKALNDLAVDYAGFVFYSKSRRCISVDQAASLKKELRPSIKAVGVFVKADISCIAELIGRSIIDLVQLHGDEPPEYLEQLRAVTKVPLIKAIRVKDRESFENLEAYDCDYFLLDGFTEGYGGNGQSFHTDLLEGISLPQPYFIAGGLSADNVRAITKKARPYGVDVSSAVEIDGVKDAGKISAFVESVRKDEESE